MLNIQWEQLSLNGILKIVNLVDEIIEDENLMINWEIRKINNKFKLSLEA